MRALRYNACKDVLDSDHKPVWAILALDVPVTDQQKKRRMCSHILKHSLAQETAAAGKPALQMSCETVRLSQVSSCAALLLFVMFSDIYVNAHQC